MDRHYTAIIQQRGKWWIGWLTEIPGVNSQARTRDELVENLSSATREALEMNRSEARAAVEGPFDEVAIWARCTS